MEGQVQEIDVVVPEGMGPGQLSPQISLHLFAVQLYNVGGRVIQ